MNLNDLIAINKMIEEYIKHFNFRNIEEYCLITDTDYNTIFLFFKATIEEYKYFSLLRKSF